MDLVEQPVEAGVDELCPETSEDAPEQGVEEADPAADIQRHLGVVPGDVAEDEFHAEGHDVLGEGQPHERLQEHFPQGRLRVPEEEQGQEQTADAVGETEGPVDQRLPALPVPVRDAPEDHLDAVPDDAADDEDREDLKPAEVPGVPRVKEVLLEMVPAVVFARLLVGRLTGIATSEFLPFRFYVSHILHQSCLK